MICMERLSESDKGGRADVKNYDEDYIVSCDRAVMACGIGMFGSGRAVRYYIPTDGRSFHTLRCFELWLRIGAMGSRSKDDYRRDRFPDNTDSRYVSDCRHRIAKDLYPDDLRNSRGISRTGMPRFTTDFKILFCIVLMHGQVICH